MYYYVAIEHEAKGDNKAAYKDGVILKDIHPLVWATQAPAIYNKGFRTRVLFWAEIPEEIATNEQVSQYFGTEETKS